MNEFFRSSLSAAALVLVISPAEASPSDSLMSKFDVSHYELSISLDLEKKTLEGSVAVTAIVIEPLNEVRLDASLQTLTIDSVKSESSLLTYRREADLLSITLPHPGRAGESLGFTIYYHGISTFHGEYEGGGVYFSTSEHAASISEPNFARRWWPCKDVPSDKATAAIDVTVPRHLTAVSNGMLKDRNEHDGMTTFRWETRYPIATYLLSIAVAPYKEFTDSYVGLDGRQMTISYYMFPEDYDKARKQFIHTPNILSVFAGAFREYPFMNEKLAYAEVDGQLTMENQTAISVQQDLITGDTTNETTIVHETAHQWWGNFITPKSWTDTWMSEGFATYAEAFYRERVYGRASYDRFIAWLMSAEQGKYAGSVVGRSDTAFWDSFHPRVYTKGAIVLHMLRGVVGDTSFFTIMRNYLGDGRLAYGNAGTIDFMEECEQVTGKSLKWFFDEWVYASPDSIDRPEYEYEWSQEHREAHTDIQLNLTQKTAQQQLFRMPVSVVVRMDRRSESFMVVDSLPSQSFTFAVDGRATSLEIDKDNYIFKILKKRGTK